MDKIELLKDAAERWRKLNPFLKESPDEKFSKEIDAFLTALNGFITHKSRLCLSLEGASLTIEYLLVPVSFYLDFEEYKHSKKVSYSFFEKTTDALRVFSTELDNPNLLRDLHTSLKNYDE